MSISDPLPAQVLDQQTAKPARFGTDFLSNIPITWKMGLIVFLFSMTILGVMAIAGNGLQTMLYHTSNIYDFMLVPIVSISNADRAMADNQFELQQLDTKNLTSAQLTQSLDKIRKNDAVIVAIISRYEREWVTTISPDFTAILRNSGNLDLQTQEVAALKKLQASFNEYGLSRQDFIASLQTGQINAQAADDSIQKLNTARENLLTLIDINNKFAEISDKAALTAYDQTVVNTGWVLLIALVIILALSSFILNSITTRLKRLASSASAFQEGDFTQSVTTVSGRDEIGILGSIFSKMGAQLKDLFDVLERRVAERTHDLELASEVGRAITEEVGNLSEMLSKAVELIRSRFDLYYAQVYLSDSSGRNLILHAGTGDAGSQLLRRGHRLPISPNSLNGRAVSERRPVLVDDTQASDSFLPNPLLPLTRSEVSIPLIVNNRVVGVLDLQSERPGAFSKANLPAFEVLAGQFAIAVQNAALFDQVNQARLEVEAQARNLTVAGWQEFLNGIDHGDRIGYVFNQKEIFPVSESQNAEFENKLRMPIQITGADIGEIQLADEATREWSPSERQILRSTVARIGQHIQNLRLLAQAEGYRAQAEQVSRRLTSEGWNDYLKNRQKLASGYIYDQNQVQPFSKDGYQTTSQSVISHSLVVHDEPIGQLAIDMDPKHDPYAADIVAAVSQQLSEHIENLRLLEQTEQQRAGADKLYKIGQKISAAQNRQEVMAAVAENIDLPQINRAILFSYEYNQSGNIEDMVISANWYSGHGVPPTPLGRRYPAKVFTVVNNFNGVTPSFVGNTQNDKRLDSTSKEVFRQQNIHAFIALPIWDDVHQIGIILLESEEVIFFTGDESVSYLSIMQQLTGALENQSLFEQTQKHADQLETVATLSNIASSLLDPGMLLQDIVDLTKERFGLYHAHIYLMDKIGGETLLLASGAGEIGRQMVAEQHTISIDKEQSLVARAFREGKAVIVDNVQNEPDFLPNPLLPDTRSEIAVPMIAGNNVLGVFDVQQSSNVGGFSKEDAAIYTTLGSQVAVALQNARLYAEQAATVTQLRELDRLKSSFLANMSHELRTPLNSILGFSDVMLEELDGPLTENMDNDLKLIQKNGQHLLHLINDVLDMAKIESGRMNLNLETFEVREILEEVASITSPLASEKNIALFITPDSDPEVEIYADHTRIRQVMINLVNNAIKFTEGGKIAISAVRQEGEKVLITVADTGLGIPPDKLEAVFDEFIQVDTSSTRKVGGTGLGLPISRKLVTMHGGRLWAESTGVEGEGSIFYVELPLISVIAESEPQGKQ
jgi:signal transduction histidine kinase/HAMP domain-containing protein